MTTKNNDIGDKVILDLKREFEKRTNIRAIIDECSQEYASHFYLEDFNRDIKKYGLELEQASQPLKEIFPEIHRIEPAYFGSVRVWLKEPTTLDRVFAAFGINQHGVYTAASFEMR